MAEIQLSAPTAGRNFTDRDWLELFADRFAILSGTGSYKLTLPTSGTIAELGSAGQVDHAVVSGLLHRISEAGTQSVSIPASNHTAGRHDLIVLRVDLGWVDPGPVRVHHISGVDGSAVQPTHDPKTDLPLYRVKVAQGQPLSAATVTDLRSYKVGG
jgi:hypothetical protein